MADRYILGLKYGPKRVDIEDFDIKKYLKDLLDIYALKVLDNDDNRDNDNIFWISGFYDESEVDAFRDYLNRILYLVGLYATDIRLLENRR